MKRKKRILWALGAGAAVVVALPLFAAFEAHVVNVTAQIENALELRTDDIEFGTVFPEEELHAPLALALSESFLDEDRVDDIDYVIRQKPKCSNGETFGRVTEDGQGNYVCEDDGFETLPLLCPFLSKHPDGTPENDGSLDAFHGPIDNWTPEDTEDFEVEGRLSKLEQDLEDIWDIDLVVPCFAGNCAQDNVVPPDYQLNPELEHALFGCDLWVEVTGVSETPTNGEPETGSITVNKVIVDESNNATTTDFSLFVGAEPVDSGVGETFAVDSYQVSESSAFATSTYAVLFSGDCDASGNIVLGAGQSLTCTITNNFDSPPPPPPE